MSFRERMQQYLRETTPEERAVWRDQRERDPHSSRQRGCAIVTTNEGTFAVQVREGAARVVTKIADEQWQKAVRFFDGIPSEPLT